MYTLHTVHTLLSFQITNGGFTTEDDLSPSDPYDTNKFDKDGTKEKDISSTNENYSKLYDEDEGHYEDETELEPADYKESETTDLYKKVSYTPFQKRHTKQYLEPPFSVYIKEHTTTDSAEEYEREERSYSDAISFDVEPKNNEKGLHPVYPSKTRPYDLRHNIF